MRLVSQGRDETMVEGLNNISSRSIGADIFVEPQLCSDGNSFEAACLSRWLLRQEFLPLSCSDLRPTPRIEHKPLVSIITPLRLSGWLPVSEAA